MNALLHRKYRILTYLNEKEKDYMMKTLNIQILWLNYIASEWNKDSGQFKF